jgi:hypothetical protein
MISGAEHRKICSLKKHKKQQTVIARRYDEAISNTVAIPRLLRSSQ